MRKIECLKKLRQPISEERKKVDTSINRDAEHIVETQKIIERKFYPLRTDHQTVIYVTKDNCNAEFVRIVACPCRYTGSITGQSDMGKKSIVA